MAMIHHKVTKNHVKNGRTAICKMKNGLNRKMLYGFSIPITRPVQAGNTEFEIYSFTFSSGNSSNSNPQVKQ